MRFADMEKLSQIISLRVSESLKNDYEGLTAGWKKKAKENALIAIAKTIHESRFDKKLYLGSDEDDD